MVLEISVLTQWGRRAYIRSKRFFLSGANGQRKGFVGNCYNECGFIHFFDTDRIQDVIFLQGRTLISEGRIPIKLNIIQAACRQNASFFNYRYHGHTDEHTFPVFVRPQRPKDCIVGIRCSSAWIFWDPTNVFHRKCSANQCVSLMKKHIAIIGQVMILCVVLFICPQAMSWEMGLKKQWHIVEKG